MNKWFVIGVMSGTSLDGVDLVYTRISKITKNYTFEIIAAETIPYSKQWENKLRNAFSATNQTVQTLNIDYGNYLAEVINGFVRKYAIDKVDFIASHGHTIFHKPEEGFTLQIGDGQTISNSTDLKVICDFRTQDVALGGQGAPLVPIGDKLLFSAYEYCLNLGGFANISFQVGNERIAFDICPVNIVLNHYTKKIGQDFDKDGNIASAGRVNKKLLNALNTIPYYKETTPKSLGFEFVEEMIFPTIEKYRLNTSDVLRTFVQHIVTQITACLDNQKESKVLVTGGGVFNKFLINELKIASKNEIKIPQNILVDFKEALVFAFLGVLRLENQVNCLRSVTGAKTDHSSGKIYTVNK